MKVIKGKLDDGSRDMITRKVLSGSGQESLNGDVHDQPCRILTTREHPTPQRSLASNYPHDWKNSLRESHKCFGTGKTGWISLCKKHGSVKELRSDTGSICCTSDSFSCATYKALNFLGPNHLLFYNRYQSICRISAYIRILSFRLLNADGCPYSWMPPNLICKMRTSSLFLVFMILRVLQNGLRFKGHGIDVQPWNVSIWIRNRY